jgi:hypothetical protein
MILVIVVLSAAFNAGREFVQAVFDFVAGIGE